MASIKDLVIRIANKTSQYTNLNEAIGTNASNIASNVSRLENIDSQITELQTKTNALRDIKPFNNTQEYHVGEVVEANGLFKVIKDVPENSQFEISNEEYFVHLTSDGSDNPEIVNAQNQITAINKIVGKLKFDKFISNNEEEYDILVVAGGFTFIRQAEVGAYGKAHGVTSLPEGKNWLEKGVTNNTDVWMTDSTAWNALPTLENLEPVNIDNNGLATGFGVCRRNSSGSKLYVGYSCLFAPTTYTWRPDDTTAYLTDYPPYYKSKDGTLLYNGTTGKSTSILFYNSANCPPMDWQVTFSLNELENLQYKEVKLIEPPKIDSSNTAANNSISIYKTVLTGLSATEGPNVKLKTCAMTRSTSLGTYDLHLDSDKMYTVKISMLGRATTNPADSSTKWKVSVFETESGASLLDEEVVLSSSAGTVMNMTSGSYYGSSFRFGVYDGRGEQHMLKSLDMSRTFIVQHCGDGDYYLTPWTMGD